MRPGGSADMRVTTEDEGDRTRVVVEALDPSGERLNFVRFTGRVVGPDGKAQNVELRQTGPGRYEGSFESVQSGAYVTNLRYVAPSEGAPGGSREGNLQVAVSRPYADEYRTLQDNAPLGKLIADLTGGRQVADNPAAAELWSRVVRGEDGAEKPLKMPVDARPIWMLVAMVGLGLFLMDVAVRRVRIDPAMIRAAVRKGLGRGAGRANQGLGSLKQVRERAQQSMTGSPGQPGGQPAQPAAPARPAAQSAADKQTAKAKFEVSEAELKKARPGAAAPVIDDSAPRREAPRPGTPGAPPPTQEQGLSRLKKARERAQEKFDEPPKND
jgi:hypothetical protein